MKVVGHFEKGELLKPCDRLGKGARSVPSPHFHYCALHEQGYRPGHEGPRYNGADKRECPAEK